MKRFFKALTAAAAIFCAAIFTVIGLASASLPDEMNIGFGGRPELPEVYALSFGDGQNIPVSGSEDAAAEAEIKAFGLFPVKNVQVNSQRRRYVTLGGGIIGIKMYTEGVIVVSVDEVMTSLGSVIPGEGAGLREGDIITKINGETVTGSDDIARAVSSGKTVALNVIRGTKPYEMHLTPAANAEGEYKAGLWVRDSSAGVGTVSFIDPATGKFAALGHAVCDVDTGELMPLSQGEAVEAGIKGIYRGSRDGPGELCGVFTGKSVGTLSLNASTGIYGRFTDASQTAGPAVPVALADEVKTGKAQLIATLDSTGPHAYDIEITKLYSAADTANRNMTITVKDEKLIEKTGGIVQGMSGSPIVQNKMLVGAVTHVFVSDPTKGYGIFAENMLEDMK